MADILIVDDEEQIRALLTRFLEAAGYRCRTAENVAAAKGILEGHRFDLILSDMTMPGESGVDLIRHITEHAPHTPMVMVSVIDQPEKAKKALELGVYGYIVKPFTRNIVLITVENALQRKQLEQEKKATMQELETLVRQRTQKLNNQLVFSQNLIDAIPSPVFHKDTEGRFQGCNAAFESLVEIRRADIVGKKTKQFPPLMSIDLFDETDRKLIDNPGKQTYEAKVTAPDGRPRTFLFNKATYNDAAGKLAGLVGVMVDITEGIAAKEALRVSEEKFRRIVENIGSGVALISPDMEILWMNGQMYEWFPEIMVADHPVCHRSFKTPPRQTICDNCPTIKALREGKRNEATFLIPIAGGERQFRIIVSPIHDKDGNAIAAIELVEDITEKLVRERELHQAQKLEAIGQLAAGIAHEINTPIQYVGDNTRFLEDAFLDLDAARVAYERLMAAVKTRSISDDIIAEVETTIKAADIPYLSKEIPIALEQSLEGIQRVSKIIQAMRRFAHPGSERKVALDINEALDSSITVARNEWKYVAEMETDFSTDMPVVNGFPGEINQVFLNIIINAAHAIGDATDGGRKGKGKITVATRAGKGAVTIRIGDTGNGIPETVRSRIFDPFFTTKAVGKGTGQGLAIARDVVVKKHAGRLHLETEAGKGTTFIIELPVADSTAKGASGDA